MNSITKETRRESYDAILPKVKKRSRLILETLGDRQMTASEITEELVAAGKIPYFNRNYVAPRLTELKDIGVLETVGRHRGRVGPNAGGSIFRSIGSKAGRQSRHRAGADDAPRARGLTRERSHRMNVESITLAVDYFDLKKIAESGQCFRWKELGPGKYLIPSGQTCAIM